MPVPAVAPTSVTSASPNTEGPPWVVDPTEPGPNLPPTGRSLFDFLVTKGQGGQRVYDVPFPFPALLARIERQLGVKAPPSPLKRLLIPVNRSLQRRASDGAFFTYPRALVAVDTEPDASVGPSGMLLKDRLFIGYHEKANVLEVISYNEAAGRFEFQVVKDYRAGGSPSVRYANRALCTACHQNQGPIFSRPLWEETNANPKVSALLAAQHRDYYGFPVRQGVGVPQAFDEATDRANEFSLLQLLWQAGCERPDQPERSIACRAELTRWLLRYVLSGGRPSDWRTKPGDKDMTPSYLAAWRARWSQGLAIPDPDLPNRNPFRFVPVQEFPGLSLVEANALEGPEAWSPFRGREEPTLRREPLEVWSVPNMSQELERVLEGFARFITAGDIERLRRLRLQDPARLQRAIERMAEQTARGQSDVFSNKPFRRARLFEALDEELQGSPLRRCCLDDRELPPAVGEAAMDAHQSVGLPPDGRPVGALRLFQRYCGACHHGDDGFPPNFLHGPQADVEANLRRCADRILVRLAMWSLPVAEQIEAPMPPANHVLHVLQHGISLDRWVTHPDYRLLRDYAAGSVQQRRGKAFDLQSLLRQDYDRLPACVASPGESGEGASLQGPG